MWCNAKNMLFHTRGSRLWDSPVPPPMLSRSRYNCNLSLLPTVVKCMLESWVWTWPCKNYLTQNVTFIRHRHGFWMHQVHDKCIAILVLLYHEKFVVWYQGQHISGQPASYAQAQSFQVQLKSFAAANCCEVHVRKLNLNSAVQKLPYTECDIYSSSGMASECTKYMTNALPYLYAVSRKVCCLVSGAAYFGPARFLRSGSVVAGTIEIFPCCQLLWSAC